MSKPKEYHSAYDGVHVDGDGDMLCAKFDDFVNLQESDCGFGRTDAEAIVELAGETRKRLEARVAELEAGYNVLANGVLAADRMMSCVLSVVAECGPLFDAALKLAKEAKQ